VKLKGIEMHHTSDYGKYHHHHLTIGDVGMHHHHHQTMAAGFTHLDHYDPVMEMSNDCHFNPEYWSPPYKNGSTPMKEMEGNTMEGRFINNFNNFIRVS
jgi:hypothetical protein